ncbi:MULTISPECIES: MMPL family transporter [Mycobacterium avium complex (MAC)]|uniref:MMPL family transporter n=1 Tax=Mycobacterium avium complex (MAC) TaxID=120793 RepID=UPI001CC6F61F|nr:MMPL family transporter [Mycobacterium avium]MBZ4535744.1 MMPL family transporter [Mycobacterium avium subsp. hominissuis]MBZ4592971.1 MMPL family transporter [Mycobacterium avium subsp. hominissuis]MBZ4635944.1 MMPL family transporter [Mycobacterium avium subsp. hominissuis]
MLQGITRLAIAAPRRVIAVTLLLMVGAAVFGLPVVNSLSGGGFQDPTSESARATDLLRQRFNQTDQQMLIAVTDPAGARSDRARRVATDIVNRLEKSPWVLNVSSAWTSAPQVAAQLISKDNSSGLVVAGLKGGENDAQNYASILTHELVHDRDGVTVRAGGMAVAYAQINHQNARDLMLMESIAIPLSFAVLVWVLGGVVAAALPVGMGGLVIVCTMSVLRLIGFATDVSTYALDLSIAMGLALAIDYNLLIISRYREELARAADRDRALFRTMATAGRTVLFSATTVGLSMAVMALFPMYFLKSSAYTIVATAVIVAVASVVVTPAAIALLGPRLDALDLRRWIARRAPSWRDHAHKPVHSLFWYRSTKFVLRHALPVGLSVVALLLLLGVPFLGVKWGFPDERVLPRSASARQVADMLDNDFGNGLGTSVSVVVPDAQGVTPADLERYAADLSRVPDVSAVTAPTGTFVAGAPAGPPAAATGMANGSAFLTVATTAPLYSPASNTQLDRLHAVAGPAGRSVEMTGLAQINRDSVDAITGRLPIVLALIAVITFTLLFLLTGSAVLPVQALVCNVLSLTAAFGAMVWIFQDGHLGALGTTPNGTLNANIPVLLFCIAFGLAMDYEVFLVSRIHEYWLASPLAREARSNPAEAHAVTDESTALGLAGIGRVVTTAALVMSISFAALIPAHVSFMRMLGVGLTLAVLADATLVRMVLVPAFIHVLGRWTWWAPRPLAGLRERLATGDAAAAAVGRRRWNSDEPQKRWPLIKRRPTTAVSEHG